MDLESISSSYGAWPTWLVLKKEIKNHFYIDVLKENVYKKIIAYKQNKILIKTYT